MPFSVSSNALRASGTVAFSARFACTDSVVCRLVRWIWVADGCTPTSTSASNGTVRPSGARTMKPDRSSVP